jgi:hypothetical protein
MKKIESKIKIKITGGYSQCVFILFYLLLFSVLWFGIFFFPNCCCIFLGMYTRKTEQFQTFFCRQVVKIRHKKKSLNL